MPGTNERRSIVDADGWEPIKPARGQLSTVLIAFAVGFVVIPALAFAATYLLLTR